MASGRCEGERDHPITLSFVYFYALLPPVTGVLGLPLVGVHLLRELNNHQLKLVG